MQRLIWSGVALFVVVIGGFFSLGLWASGISTFSGVWGQGAYLGLVLLAVSVGLAAVVYLLAELTMQRKAADGR